MNKGREGESYQICGEAHTLVEAMNLAESITGIPGPRAVPPSMLSAMSSVMAVIESVVNVPPVYTSEALRALAGVTYLGDNSKAKRELGFDPRPLKVGVTETLRHEMTLLNMNPKF